MPPGVYPRPSALERLLSNFTINPVTGCWEWQGHRHRGYGLIAHKKPGTAFRAHRLSYETFIGPIPDDKPKILHTCDNPPCFFPEHLFAGTDTDNMADRDAKGRVASGRRQGTHTHPETVRRGERHPGAKLTNAQVAEIRTRLSNGELCPPLGREFGVSRYTINSIKLNKIWKDAA